ncbi:hypothetical protein O6H91_10G083300 [Diphasiastrum complanatum]|uniref:Uncharacterized protein n=1 Tax=Diphasiastrum complanatum TaxID=34168 RepID=A0ACC2CJU8_DIPCM|nr:hypothetical protein O6H91_10G083300 [Diphasiastrum complanatum]
MEGMESSSSRCERKRKVEDAAPHENSNPKKLLRWSKAETLLLLTAKRKREDGLLILSATPGGEKISDVNKWKRICDSLRMHGLDRDHVACKKRWFHLVADYKKIQDWQRTATAGLNSFWLMQPHERRDNRLPSGFDKDIYAELDAWLGGGSPVVDASRPILQPPAIGSGDDNLDFHVESSRPYFYTDAKPSAKKRQRQSAGKVLHMQDHSIARDHLEMRESLIHVLEKNGKTMEIALRENCQAQIDAQKQISQAQVDTQKHIIELQMQQGREFVGAMYALVGVLGELAKSLRTTMNGI